MQNQYCDPETGECAPADLSGELNEALKKADGEIIYVGDPMCSWCWGISNHLQELKQHFSEYNFSIVLGGLRPGGGDPWDDNFKAFLKHHWEEVTARSGQPFGYSLFDRESFNYDTEPPCRAVVASRKWLGDDVLAFYEAVSKKFYVDNEDPGEEEFYRSICEVFEIPFDEFLTAFESEEVKYQTKQDFLLNRQWGVRGYPTVLFKFQEQLYQINHGYSEFEAMKGVIEKVVSSNQITQVT
ncbi:MAG: DsbA family protein [Cytophagales bacterium]|nr:DsbA family protein [Cytophagales bacterium]